MGSTEQFINRQLCISRIALIIFIIAWIWLEIAVAQGTLNEHAEEISRGQWYAIIALIGIVQTLIAFIYISGQRAMSKSIDDVKADLEKREILLLNTRSILLELKGEHKAMMEKCHSRVRESNMSEEEDRND